MKITKIEGLNVWTPVEDDDKEFWFTIPKDSIAVLSIEDLKVLNELLTSIIQEHNSKINL